MTERNGAVKWRFVGDRRRKKKKRPELKKKKEGYHQCGDKRQSETKSSVRAHVKKIRRKRKEKGKER